MFGRNEHVSDNFCFFLTRREKGTDLRKINCSIVVFINQVKGFLFALGHLRVICPCELIPVGQRLFYLHHLDLEVEHGTPGDEVVCNAMLRLNQGVPTWVHAPLWPMGTIACLKGAFEASNKRESISIYYVFLNIYTYISQNCFQKSLYAYC